MDEKTCDWCGGTNDVDDGGACKDCRQAWENDPPLCLRVGCNNPVVGQEMLCPSCLKYYGVKSSRELQLTINND